MKSKNITKIKGELEIDHRRGVIYFHVDAPHAYGTVTMLRICKLPTPIPQGLELDIMHMYGANWEGKILSIFTLPDKSKRQ